VQFKPALRTGPVGLNVKNPVKHAPYFKEKGKIRALTLEEVDKYLAAAMGDLRDFAILATETGGRPNEVLALHKRSCPPGRGLCESAGNQKRESSARCHING
jgi:integrase